MASTAKYVDIALERRKRHVRLHKELPISLERGFACDFLQLTFQCLAFQHAEREEREQLEHFR